MNMTKVSGNTARLSLLAGSIITFGGRNYRYHGSKKELQYSDNPRTGWHTSQVRIDDFPVGDTEFDVCDEY